jgi:hypothetical protein
MEYLPAMASSLVRPLAVLAATTLVSLGAAPAAAASGTTEPLDSAASEPGCAEITGLLDAVEAFGFAFATGDIETLEAVLPQLAPMASQAEAAAPDDIAETVETWVAPFPLIAIELARVDLSDPDAFEQAVTAIDTRASDVARQEVEAWAEFHCGWTSSLDVEQVAAPEPAACEELDAAAATEASGIDVDVDDLDGSADVNLPGFSTKSCSYGNGAMSLSTLSFNTIEDAQQFYADNLDNVGGVVLEVAVGELPASSQVIQTGVAVDADTSVPSTEEPAVVPTVQVVVFEAPFPFSVTFTGDDVDPAAVVAAAEAVLAAQLGEAPTPETTVA